MKKAVIAFLALMIIAGASDVARRLGWIDGIVEKRALGLVIGALALVIGNYLPKIRPLRSPSNGFRRCARSGSADRRSR